jgi:hypothetical protein
VCVCISGGVRAGATHAGSVEGTMLPRDISCHVHILTRTCRSPHTPLSIITCPRMRLVRQWP